MFSTFLIGAFALVLFVYWLRYNCVLILKRQFTPDRTAEVASANGLRLAEVRQRLESRPRVSDLPGLYRSLIRDHKILTALVRYTAVFQGGTLTLDQRLLALDFRAAQGVFLATHIFAPRQARAALAEALRVLEYFANVVGERAVPAGA